MTNKWFFHRIGYRFFSYLEGVLTPYHGSHFKPRKSNHDLFYLESSSRMSIVCLSVRVKRVLGYKNARI